MIGLPAVTEAMRGLPARSVTLDGEVVICGADGRSNFDRMRSVFGRHGAPDAFVYAFDLLEIDGALRGEPWHVRRAALTGLL
jgi:bifunctional non-homologous end joining protein LigD